MKVDSGTGRLIAVGDIHGCLRQLKLVLEAINPQPEDVFVFLGDFVDRGPDSKGVIDEVINLGKICTVYPICGNHEEMVLGAFAGGPSDHHFWCKFGGIEMLASYGVNQAKNLPGEHLYFISKCFDYIETEDFIFVHAGCDHNAPPDRQSGDKLRWNKFPDEPKPHISGKTVICGHTVHPKILNLGFLMCIDTGCGVIQTGRLTAIDVKSGRVWQAGGRNKKATVKELKDAS